MNFINNNISSLQSIVSKEIIDRLDSFSISDQKTQIVCQILFSNSKRTGNIDPALIHFFYQSALSHNLQKMKIAMIHPDFSAMPTLYLEKAFLEFCDSGFTPGIELFYQCEILHSKLSRNIFEEGLYIASKNNHKSIVTFLLKVGRNIDKGDAFVTSCGYGYGNLALLFIKDEGFDQIDKNDLRKGWIEISAHNLVRAFTLFKKSPAFEKIDTTAKAIGFKKACKAKNRRVIKKYIPLFKDLNWQSSDLKHLGSGLKYAIKNQDHETIDLFFKEDWIEHIPSNDLGICLKDATKIADNDTIKKLARHPRRKNIPLLAIKKGLIYSFRGPTKTLKVFYENFKEERSISLINQSFVTASSKLRLAGNIRMFMQPDLSDEISIGSMIKAINSSTYRNNIDGLRAIINSKKFKNNRYCTFFTDSLTASEKNILNLINLMITSQNSQKAKVFHLGSILKAIAIFDYPKAIKKIIDYPLFHRIAAKDKIEALQKSLNSQKYDIFYLLWNHVDKKQFQEEDIATLGKSILGYSQPLLFKEITSYFGKRALGDTLFQASVMGTIKEAKILFASKQLKLLDPVTFSTNYWHTVHMDRPEIALLYLQSERALDISLFNLEQTLYIAAESRGFEEVIRTIISSNRLEEIPDETIFEALEIAQYVGNSEIASLLQGVLRDRDALEADLSLR